jgi:hypothetical protein
MSRKLRVWLYLIWLWMIGQKPIPVAIRVTILGSLLFALPSLASAQSIGLTWKDNSADEAGFEIQRRTGTSGTYVEITKTAANIQAYKDIGLNFATLYCYRVRAFNTNGLSAWSNETCASTIKPPPPTAPSDARAKPE